MIFSELENLLEESSNDYNKFITQFNVYIESVRSEYNKELREHEISVLEEGSNDNKDTDEEDKLEKSTKEYINSITKAIKAKGKKFSEFANNTAKSVKDFFGSKKEDKTKNDILTSIAEKCKETPGIAQSTIGIVDVKGISNTVSKYQNEVLKLDAKVKSKKHVTNEDFNKLREIEKNSDKDIAIKCAVVVTVTVVAAIATIKTIQKEIEKETAYANEISKKMQTADFSSMSTEEVDYVMDSLNLQERLERTSINKLSNALKVAMNDLRHLIKEGSKPVNIDNTEKLFKKESVDENESYDIKSTSDYINMFESELIKSGLFDPKTVLESVIEEIDDKSNSMLDELISESVDDSVDDLDTEVFESMDDLLKSIDDEYFLKNK